MRYIHEKLFELLVEIDDICKNHDIDYFLAGGTSLGALRNQCFLPWDDDIDLYITRDNWIKLRDLISENPEILPKNRNLICIENEQYHRNPIVRYVDTQTTAIYSAQSISAKTCGNQIEFFILDPIPNVEDGQAEYLDEYYAYLEVLSSYFIVCTNLSLKHHERHRELVFKYYNEIDEKGYDEVMDGLYGRLFNYPLEKTDTLCLRWGNTILVYESEFYSKKRFVMLEGREFPIANGLEHVLRVDYGDTWMYIPEDDGKLSHDALVEDLNRPFEDFTKIYLPHINQEEVTNAYEMNKRINLQLWAPRRELDIEKEKLHGILAKKELYKIIEVNNYNPRELLDNRQYDILNELFSDYYLIQLKKNCRKNNIFISLDDMDLIKIAIENKIRQGHYYDANDILDVIEHNFGFDEYFRHYRDICIYCKKLSITIYDYQDMKALENLLDSGFEDCKDLIDTYRAQLHLDLFNAKENSDYELIIKKANEMLLDYPKDGEIMAYIAQAYYHLGDEKNAIELYDKAVHHTRNGFVWQYAKRDVGIDRMAEEEIYVE